MSRRRKDRKTRQAREHRKAAEPPALRTDAYVLDRRHMLFLYLHHLHTGRSAEQIADSFGIDPAGLRERFEFTESVLDRIFPAGESMHERFEKFNAACERGPDEAGADDPAIERIQKRMAARGQEAGKGPA